MYDQLVNLQNDYQQFQMEYWLSNNLFSGLWWLIVITNLSFFILFIILIDKKNVLLMSLAFIISFTLIGISNETGNYFGYWDYPYQFLPFLETFNAVDFLIVPVIISLMYQFINNWMKYLIANVIVSGVLSFIGIPVAVRLNLYVLNNWNVINSFVVLLVTGIVLKSLTDFLKSKSIDYSA